MMRSQQHANSPRWSANCDWLSARVASAIEVDLSKQPRDRVAFGATVTVESDEGERRWQIVGEDEADAEHGLVSYVSPLARR